MAAAAKLEAQAERKDDRVDLLQSRADKVVAPVIQREAPKVQGVSMREVWKFEVTDATQVPREYLVVDETKIRKVVAALRSDAKIPGVRVYAERQVAAGAA